MLTLLEFEDFKSFRKAKMKLGPLNVVIGANASGKSNIRDAVRFLHGVSRSYTLAEIIGEKYAEGYLQWDGIRGGLKEICRAGTNHFSLAVGFRASGHNGASGAVYHYRIGVTVDDTRAAPRVVQESLYRGETLVFDSHPQVSPPHQDDPMHVSVRLRGGGAYRKMGPRLKAISHQPVLTQILELARQRKLQGKIRDEVTETLQELESVRFIDLSPEAMRKPSVPGQTALSDQGENLSSVLHSICQDPHLKSVLSSWIGELTPMDVVDFDFVPDPQGKILVYLVEKSGRKTSAYSASDGTLRFLGILTALLGPKSSKFYFLEEIDNGIHPARLYLLMNLLEERTSEGKVQVFTTTHSPQLLRLIRGENWRSAAVTYRVEGVEEARIRSLPEVPHLMEVIREADIARLFEGGWMEQTMFFAEGEPAPVQTGPVEEHEGAR